MLERLQEDVQGFKLHGLEIVDVAVLLANCDDWCQGLGLGYSRASSPLKVVDSVHNVAPSFLINHTALYA